MKLLFSIENLPFVFPVVDVCAKNKNVGQLTCSELFQNFLERIGVNF